MTPEVSFSNIPIANCPIACKECKIIYANRETGFKITCHCKCHELEK